MHAVIHQTMAWTTGSLTCVHDLLLHAYTHMFAVIDSVILNGCLFMEGVGVWIPFFHREGTVARPPPLYDTLEATLTHMCNTTQHTPQHKFPRAGSAALTSVILWPQIESKDADPRDFECEGMSAWYGSTLLYNSKGEITLTLFPVSAASFPTAVWIEVVESKIVFVRLFCVSWPSWRFYAHFICCHQSHSLFFFLDDFMRISFVATSLTVFFFKPVETSDFAGCVVLLAWGCCFVCFSPAIQHAWCFIQYSYP